MEAPLNVRHTKNSIALLALSLSCMLATNNSKADVVTVLGGTISTPDANATIGTTTAAVGSASTAIVTAIGLHGSDRATDSQKLLAALQSLFAQNSQDMRDITVNHGAAAAQVDSARIWGVSGTDQNCLPDSQGQQMADGKSNVRVVASASGTYMENRARGFKTTEGTVNDIIATKPESITSVTLEPPNGVRSGDDQVKKAAVTSLAVDPAPPITLSTNVKGTAEGKRYEALRTLYEAGKLAARTAAAEADAYNAPTFKPGNGAWASGVLAETGFNASDYTDSSGNYSQSSFLNLMVDYRMKNDQWLINAKDQQDDVWQLRHINMSTAVLLEMQKKELDIMNHILEMEAKLSAIETDQALNPELDSARAKAISKD